MTQTPSTGAQLLERILIQLEYQSAELIGINAGLDTMNENLSVGSSNGTSDDGTLVEFDAAEIVTTFDDSGTRKLFRIKGGQLNRRVTLMMPFQNMEIPDPLQKPLKHINQAAFMIATGLAFQKLD